MPQQNAPTDLGARWLSVLRELGVGVGVESPLLEPGVYPTFTVEPGVNRIVQPGATGSLGTGTQIVFTVPAFEKHYISYINIFRQSGDRTSTVLRLMDPTGATQNIDAYSAASDILFVPGNPLPVGPGWSIALVIGGGSSDGAWEANMFSRVVDAVPGGT
jgi:hypothetical protein